MKHPYHSVPVVSALSARHSALLAVCAALFAMRYARFSPNVPKEIQAEKRWQELLT